MRPYTFGIMGDESRERPLSETAQPTPYVRSTLNVYGTVRESTGSLDMRGRDGGPDNTTTC